MRLSIGRKLVIGFLPVVLTAASLGVLTYRELDHLHQLADSQDELTDRAQGVLQLSLKVKDLQGLAIHYIGAHEAEYQQQFGGTKSDVLAAFNKLAQAAPVGSESDAWGQARDSLQHLVMMAEATLSGTADMDHSDGHMQMDQLDAAGAHVEAAMEQLRQITEQRRVGAQAEFEALEHRMKYMLSVATLLVAGFSGVALLMAQRVSRPLQAFVQSAQRVASGDLTVGKLVATSGDEVGDMAAAFSQMVDSLRGLVGQVTVSVQTVASSAEQLNGAVVLVSDTITSVEADMGQVDAGASRQRGAAEQANTSVGHLKRSIDQLAAGAEEQAEQARDLTQVVEQMMTAVQRHG